jgi:hypothetical protein
MQKYLRNSSELGALVDYVQQNWRLKRSSHAAPHTLFGIFGINDVKRKMTGSAFCWMLRFVQSRYAGGVRLVQCHAAGGGSAVVIMIMHLDAGFGCYR